MIADHGLLPKRGWEKNTHFTLAFIDETKDCEAVRKAMEKLIASGKVKQFSVCFDKVDFFLSRSGKEFILFLSPRKPEESINKVAELVRECVKETGHELESDFLPHVTLARIEPSLTDENKLRAICNEVNKMIKAFDIRITQAYYKGYGGTKLDEYKLTK